MNMLTCAATIIINLTSFAWNANDQKALDRAKFVCKTDERYEGYRCLAKLIKTEERAFRALCGVSK